MSNANTDISYLKSKFKAGAIPLEEHYTLLFDTLEETRRAVGTSPDSQLISQSGLMVGDNDTLAVKIASDKGLQTDDKGLGIKCKTAGGVSVDATGISAQLAPSGGIIADSQGLKIACKTGGGLAVGSEGVSVSLEALWAYCIARSNRATYYGYNSRGVVICVNQGNNVWKAKYIAIDGDYLAASYGYQCAVIGTDGSTGLAYTTTNFYESIIGISDVSGGKPNTIQYTTPVIPGSIQMATSSNSVVSFNMRRV